ncbi:RNA-binding protein [Aurantimonas sp. VKM B-3413]|uniref:RNA-binding protein n=1 Tax=Aurantimonas sp. VKM B-3413 TaxID=2779401 RepID=UPI0021069565|nr:RNA-binding protein [Aurantimonas sp. VKM B-3413]MCB8840825.1 RNA-binding protein [Aurantimonas sp. VKM B-3413]
MTGEETGEALRVDPGEAGGKDDGESRLNERTCIVTRTTQSAEDLLRFVRSPDGDVVPDLRRRLPGRGAHVAFDRRAVDEAARRKLFARAFRAETKVPADLGERVDALLVKLACGSLGFAKKAGQLVTGAEKVSTAVRSGRAVLVVHAVDAAPDGIRKLDAARLAAAAGIVEKMVPALRLIQSDELGLALGGVNVIHAAILAGDAGSAARKRLEALAKYRGLCPDMADGDALLG